MNRSDVKIRTMGIEGVRLELEIVVGLLYKISTTTAATIGALFAL